MIHADSAPYRVLKISELARLIASQFVLIGARKSAVNLACACRSFEESILSTLWETQWSLLTLLGVLPEQTRERGSGKRVLEVVGDPSPEDWNRVRRYASWMCHVRIVERTGEETSNKLRLNSPPGGWFPALQDLFWCITGFNLPYVDLFFSPRLKNIYICTAWLSKHAGGIPLGILPTLVSTISALPTSSLERILAGTRNRRMFWAHLKDSFSSTILRCGPSFTEYDFPVPLSTAALEHLIQLPHLRTWRIHGPPPTYPTSYLPPIFPPLRELTLGDGAALGWLPLLGRLEDDAATTQGVAPLSKTKESLKILNVEDISSIKICASSISTIQYFQCLVHLKVEGYCCGRDGRDQCIFKLNNDNVTELAMALTQLESLLLGCACSQNTCLTTVACLLPISVHCNKLKKLEIHFNTTNIVDDFKNALEDPRFRQLRSFPRCSLTCLDVRQMPLSLDDSGSEIVAKGMIDIFPSLIRCRGFERSWAKLSREIRNFQVRSG